MTTGTLRDRMRAAATEAMLDSAERAMVRLGYHKATMQQIASEAGCAAGTFYLYFKNKEELLEAIVARHAVAMFGAAREAIATAQEPLEKVRAGIQYLVEYGQSHGDFFRLFFTAMPVRHRIMEQQVKGQAKEENERYRQLQVASLRAAQKQGRIRKDLSAEVLMNFIEDVCVNVVERFAFDDKPASVKERMRVLWGLITGGIDSKERP